MVKGSRITTHRAKSVLAAALLGLFAAVPASAVPNEGRIRALATGTGCDVSPLDTLVIPRGARSLGVEYSLAAGVCPATTYCCTTYTDCHRCTIVYSPQELTFTVTDSTGAVLFTDTQTVTPIASDASPPPSSPPQRFVRHFDVSALTAAGDATVTFQVTSCATGDPSTNFHICWAGVQGGLVDLVPVDPPRFVFDLDQALATADPDQAKLLINKYDTDSYFSGLQRTTPTVPSDPPAPFRPQMNITGGVINAPANGPHDIFFKLLDPMDTADYAVHDAHVGDNADIANPAVLMLTDGTSRTPAGQVLHTLYSPGVKVALVLEGTGRYAGDNYKIEASFDPAFACENEANNPCATSATITAWKRIYIRPYKMFRYGAFLATDANAGDTGITIQENTPGETILFQPGQTLLLIHQGDHQRQPESVTIRSGTTSTGLQPIVDRLDGTWFIRLSAPLRNAYSGPRPRLYPATADAIGVPTTYFEANITGLAAFYATMSVDAVTLHDQVFDQFPYLAEFGGDQPVETLTPAMLASRFLGGTFEVPLHENVFRVVGADNYKMLLTPTGGCDSNLGETTDDYSYVFVGNIDRIHAGVAVVPCTVPLPLQLNHVDAVNLATVVHETVHQWGVDRDSLLASVHPSPTGGATGHCIATAQIPPGRSGDICLMHWRYPSAITTSNWDQINTPRLALHWLGGGADSEYTQVRGHEEPVH